MLAILNSLNAHNLPIFEPILMILVAKFMFYKALSYKIYLSLGLLSSLIKHLKWVTFGPQAKRHLNSVSLAGRWWSKIYAG